MLHLWESIAQPMKHCFINSPPSLGLIRTLRQPLVSIAFNDKWFVEFSLQSISMFHSVHDVSDSIADNFISNIQLLAWIYFSHLQEISSFNSIFCIHWLNITSKNVSALRIRWDSTLASRICIQCGFFIEENSHQFLIKAM